MYLKQPKMAPNTAASTDNAPATTPQAGNWLPPGDVDVRLVPRWWWLRLFREKKRIRAGRLGTTAVNKMAETKRLIINYTAQKGHISLMLTFL
jgi:hypothetical protein